MKEYTKLIFEISKEGGCGYKLPSCDVENIDIREMIPEHLLSKKDLFLPEVSEVDVIRHYTLLSNKNY